MAINIIEPDEESLKSPISVNPPIKLEPEPKSPNVIDEETTEFKGISLNAPVSNTSEKRRLSVHGKH